MTKLLMMMMMMMVLVVVGEGQEDSMATLCGETLCPRWRDDYDECVREYCNDWKICEVVWCSADYCFTEHYCTGPETAWSTEPANPWQPRTAAA